MIKGAGDLVDSIFIALLFPLDAKTFVFQVLF